MPPRTPCEFSLIRYVPDVVKGEFVNIGVLLREAVPGAAAQVRFTRDWSRVRCIDGDADVAMLEALESEIAECLHAESLAAPLKPLLPLLADTLSNSLQITEPRACLAETFALELDQLMRLYVDPLRVRLARPRTGRAAIAAAMRSEFERTGVWSLMRKRIAASLYTRPGDPMKLDCGYRTGSNSGSTSASGPAPGLVRIFHAVSLENDVEAAKSLAYTAPQLREGILRVEAAPLELTAVVEPIRSLSGEDFADEAADRYRFGIDEMERQQIRVLTISDLARAAETARIDLHL